MFRFIEIAWWVCLAIYLGYYAVMSVGILKDYFRW
jgi:hypothetical protein